MTDKDNPSYESLAYKAFKEKFRFVENMYKGREVWYSPHEGIYDPVIHDYLPREPKEPADQYYNRVSRSYMKNVFRDSIHSTAGFLKVNLNDDVLESIWENRDNIDGKGNSIDVFFQQADISALKYGFCCILIDYPNQTASTLYESKTLKRRPYLILIERPSIPNGKVEQLLSEVGSPISQLSFKQDIILDDGAFGEKAITEYRVIGRQEYQVWHQEDNTPYLVDDGSYSLPILPLIVYSLTGVSQDIFSTPIPLYDLVEMELQLFQKESDRDAIIHKLCPFLLINERVAGTLSEEDIVIGPNTYLRNCDAQFVSPGPDAIGPMQEDIDRLVESIKLKTLAFQSGNARVATATEINRDTASSEASLVNMAKRKESAIQSVFEIWAMWENKPGKGGTIQVNSAVLQKQVEEAKIELYKSLRNNGSINNEQYLSLLKTGGWLPSEFESDDDDDSMPPADLIAWFDLLLKHQVVSPDVVINAIKDGKSLKEALSNIPKQIDAPVIEDQPEQVSKYVQRELF